MAGLSLEKKQKMSLNKSSGTTLKRVRAELRWDAPENTRFEYDADASAFVLDANQKAVDNYKHFCFYSQPNTPAIVSSGDNRTGGGDGEDLTIDLTQVPSAGEHISIVITLHDAAARGQNLSQIANGSLTLVDDESGKALAHVVLDMNTVTRSDISMLFVMLHRNGSDWDIENVTQGYPQDLSSWVDLYGIDLNK